MNLRCTLGMAWLFLALAGARAVDPKQRSDSEFQRGAGGLGRQALAVAQPAPGLVAEQEVERLEARGVAAKFRRRLAHQDLAQRLGETGMVGLQPAGARTTQVRGAAEWRDDLESGPPSTDQDEREVGRVGVESPGAGAVHEEVGLRLDAALTQLSGPHVRDHAVCRRAR